MNIYVIANSTLAAMNNGRISVFGDHAFLFISNVFDVTVSQEGYLCIKYYEDGVEKFIHIARGMWFSIEQC